MSRNSSLHVSATALTTEDLPTPGGPHRKAGQRVLISFCRTCEMRDGFNLGLPQRVQQKVVRRVLLWYHLKGLGR